MVLTQTKAVPVYGGKWHGEAMTKGERLKAAKCHEMFPLSFAYAQQLPRKRWSLLGAVRARRTVPYPFAERSFQWGYGGCRGGLRGEIEIFPGPPAKKVIRKLLSLLFISTPKSIAKPSPGWNKVALLTAVRNSPCSCPFSVSLHPPLAALSSEPRPGSLLVRFTTQT